MIQKEIDIFQQRYIEHQERKHRSLEGDIELSMPKREYDVLKRKIFKDILINRRSQRIFNNDPISNDEMEYLLLSVFLSPSSCNRQAVYLKYGDADFLNEILVGGKGWVKNANIIFLFFAHKDAYKSPNEKLFMPYLDVGVCVQSMYLTCEVLNLGCCFINPNIGDINKQLFINTYGDDYFGGAMAIGGYDKKSIIPPLRNIEEVIEK